MSSLPAAPTVAPRVVPPLIEALPPTPDRKLPLAAAAVLLLALAAVAFWPAKPVTASLEPLQAVSAPAVAAEKLVVRSLDTSLASTEAPTTDDGHLVELPLAERGERTSRLGFDGTTLKVVLVTMRTDTGTTTQLVTEPPAPLRVDDILQGARATLTPGTKPQLVTVRAPDRERPLRFAVSLRAP